MQPEYLCFASAAFGMEGLVARDLMKTGVREIHTENGGVRFLASPEQVYLCNLQLRFSDRVYLILAEGLCNCFEDLFQLVGSIDWSGFYSGSESVDIACKCVKSILMSPRDCQSVAKKSIIEKLRKTTAFKVFPENGPSLSVHISIRNNKAVIMLNTSGNALSRRGYRTWNGEAPLRETLAAALVELSPWRPGLPLHDPCCGTGTILIEAAMISSGIAPGLQRQFAMESLSCFSDLPFSKLKTDIAATAGTDCSENISGSDIDPAALELAERHIWQAAIRPHAVSLQQIPLQHLTLSAEKGVFICNPPYGERISSQKECRALYHDLSLLMRRHPGWYLCAISSDPAFERSFGRKAEKKRRLYNGRLECVYYIYSASAR